MYTCKLIEKSLYNESFSGNFMKFCCILDCQTCYFRDDCSLQILLEWSRYGSKSYTANTESYYGSHSPVPLNISKAYDEVTMEVTLQFL